MTSRSASRHADPKPSADWSRRSPYARRTITRTHRGPPQNPHGWYATPGHRSCGFLPVTACSPRSSPACGPSPRSPDHRPHGPVPGTWNPRTRRDTRASTLPAHQKQHPRRSETTLTISSAHYSRIRVRPTQVSSRPATAATRSRTPRLPPTGPKTSVITPRGRRHRRRTARSRCTGTSVRPILPLSGWLIKG